MNIVTINTIPDELGTLFQIETSKGPVLAAGISHIGAEDFQQIEIFNGDRRIDYDARVVSLSVSPIMVADNTRKIGDKVRVTILDPSYPHVFAGFRESFKKIAPRRWGSRFVEPIFWDLQATQFKEGITLKFHFDGAAKAEAFSEGMRRSDRMRRGLAAFAPQCVAKGSLEEKYAHRPEVLLHI